MSTHKLRYLRMMCTSVLLAVGAGLLMSSAPAGGQADNRAFQQRPDSPRPLKQPPTTSSGSRVALLIGISDYPGTENDLEGGPLNDVALMSDLLINKLSFAPADVITLTDAEATPSNILDVFNSRLTKVPPAGVVVLFFSGHGSQFADKNGEETDSLDEVLVIRGDSSETYDILRDDDLGTMAGLLQAQHVLVILDNCHSGTGTRGVGRQLDLTTVAGTRAATLNLRPALDSLHRAYLPKRITSATLRTLLTTPSPYHFTSAVDAPEPTSHVLLAASAASELSISLSLELPDGSKVGVGLLTASLYLSLGTDNTRTTTFTALTSSLRKTAREATAAIGAGPQTPQIEGLAKNQTIAAFLRVP